jgi:dyslexia susceptibility 1 candidate gene 1 protein
LKVNFSPYILDIVLFKEVDSVKHKATVKDGVLSITLCKKEPGLWGAIEIDGSKEEIKAAKMDASAQQAVLNETLSQQRHERKLAEEKHSLRKQMKLEEMERTRVENLKQEEKESAEKEVYEAFAQMHMKENKVDGKAKPPAATTKKAVSFGADSTAPLPIPPTVTKAPSTSNIDSFLAADDIDDAPRGDGKQPKYSMEEIDESEDDEWEKVASPVPGAKTDIFDGTPQYTEEEEEEVRYVPPPRSSGLSTNADQKIGISFTPRVFPTPMRESKAAEEEDWVAKNRRHIKNHGVLGKSKLWYSYHLFSLSVCLLKAAKPNVRLQEFALF